MGLQHDLGKSMPLPCAGARLGTISAIQACEWPLSDYRTSIGFSHHSGCCTALKEGTFVLKEPSDIEGSTQFCPLNTQVSTLLPWAVKAYLALRLVVASATGAGAGAEGAPGFG